MLIVRGLAIWFLVLALLFINGAVRHFVSSVVLGTAVAAVLHTVIACVAIAWLAHRIARRDASLATLALLGVLWAGMTVGFETGLVILGDRPASDVLDRYDPSQGRLWVIVVATLVLAPPAAGLYHRLSAKGCPAGRSPPPAGGGETSE